MGYIILKELIKSDPYFLKIFKTGIRYQPNAVLSNKKKNFWASQLIRINESIKYISTTDIYQINRQNFMWTEISHLLETKLESQVMRQNQPY